MLIENSIYRNSYVANGTSTEFTISFPFLDASHIIVYKNINGLESVVEAREYSVAGAGDEHGGTITFTSAPSNGTTIVIARNVPITQLHKYTELDNFPAQSHEDALAKLTMIDQQQQDSINRAIKLAETDTRTPDELLNEIFTAKDVAVACATESCQCADNADTSRNEALQFRNEAQSILNNTISEGNKAIANVQAQEASSIQAVKDQEATSVAEVVAEGDTQAVRLVGLASNILVSGTAYNKEVTAYVTVDTPANTYITLPVDSKGNQLMYRVGAAMIRMSYNGAQMYVGDQFDEVGIAGSISTQIKVNFDLEVGSRLNFFIIAQNVTVIVDKESGLSIDDQNRLTAKALKDSTVHTVDGNAPDAAGNITPAQTGCLPLTGGTLTGNMSFPYGMVGSDIDKKSVFITARTDTQDKNDGAFIVLESCDTSGVNGGGNFSISTRGNDGIQGPSLIGTRDGYLLWNGSETLLPVGSIFAFAANANPYGCLICNGAEVSRTTYAKLFAIIGTIYGAGDSSTTFNLPNLTDRFIQGSGTAGTVKSAGLPNAIGEVGILGGLVFDSGEDALTYYNIAGTSISAQTFSNYSHVIRLDLSKSNATYGASTTVQPPALTMRYYIKY